MPELRIALCLTYSQFAAVRLSKLTLIPAVVLRFLGGYHSRLGWQDRLRITADEGSFTEFDSAMGSENPIGFPFYKENIRELQRKTGTGEAVVSGACAIMGYPAVICIMDSRFMMASMGSVVGEKITRVFEYGTEHKLPVIIFTASGGARMQEGIFSLMQMAKTSGAAARHARAGQLYITVMAVTLIAQVRGRDIEELKRVNFSMPHPEGYRKAVRLAKQAERFHRPEICFIDTPGAYCVVAPGKYTPGTLLLLSLRRRAIAPGQRTA
ncbi:hypothetical protein AGMMS50268_11840 [Spirochaetia bacterium]|nr:hypothetical protein AGMMS50268_11840 [Spirochaetia bacterium]